MSKLTARRAAKFGVTAAVALAAYGLDVKVQKDAGVDLATAISSADVSFGAADANAACGAAYNCSGGGGQCGAAYNCSGGGGQCGAAYNCSGS